MKKKTLKNDLETRLAALPDKKRLHVWTPEMDRLILKYAADKGIPAVASILGIPHPTVYNRLTKIQAGRK